MSLTIHQYDRAWKAIRNDDELERARRALSIHEMRSIISHCAEAFAPADPKRHLSDKPELIDGCECAICEMHRKADAVVAKPNF